MASVPLMVESPCRRPIAVFGAPASGVRTGPADDTGPARALGALRALLVGCAAAAVVVLDTPFHIASRSEPLTATAVMQLVETGSVDLDEPVSNYLPELRPGRAAVTVRDLVHHRSGLSIRTGTEPMSSEFGDSLTDNVGRLAPMLRTGAPYEYSNANYDALALLVERVAGLPFAEYMREQVFTPLEMDGSFLDPDRAAQAGLAQGHYRWLLLGFRPHDAPPPPSMVGSAAMYSSAGDLTRFLIAHLNAGTYGSDQALFLHVSRGVRALILGLEAAELTPGSPRAVRFGKHLSLLLVLTQLTLVAVTIPVAARTWRGHGLGRGGWTAITTAAGVDLAVVATALALPRAFDAPLTAALDLPDYRILLLVAAVGLTWGLARTATVGVGLLRQRNQPATY